MIEETSTHESAYKQVSGYAEYTDEINEPKMTIYGAMGLSKKAHAVIKKIDLTDVKTSIRMCSRCERGMGLSRSER